MSVSLIILTGQSGSGKSTAMRALEDKGYYCVDNTPTSLVQTVIETIISEKLSDRVAIVMDTRAPHFAEGGLEVAMNLRQELKDVRIVFFEANKETIIRRYSETRRIHPMDSGTGLLQAIEDEQNILIPFRESADDTIDTSDLSPHDLRFRIHQQFSFVDIAEDLRITFLSFGFKHGVPLSADMVLDVRFLPNPYFVPDLRHKTGMDNDVKDYVLSFEKSGQFLKHTIDMLSFLMPEYHKEGKRYFTVAIGCTGGQHRSVSIARELKSHFQKLNIPANLRHRDIKETPQ